MFQTLANIERKISEMGKLRKAKKEAHKKNYADFLTRKNYINSSEFTEEKIVESCEVQEPTATEKVAQMTEQQVDQKFGKRVEFERCSRPHANTGKLYWFAKRGNIDGDKFTAYSELTKWLNPSKKPDSNGKTRVFYNYEKPNGLFITQAKKAGFEVVFK